MNLCLAISPNDDLYSLPKNVQTHVFSALVEDKAALGQFSAMSLSARVKSLQFMVGTYCQSIDEDTLMVDLPPDVPRSFVVGLIGKSGERKRSDTPEPTVAHDESVRIIEVASNSDPSKVYQVSVEGNQVTRCTCVGYNVYKDCVHAKNTRKSLLKTDDY